MNDATVLRWFLAVAEIGAFGRAARDLSISRHRLSAAIRDLEAEVGERVFVTDESGTHLTPAGEALSAHARAVVAADDERRRAEPAPAPVPALRIGFVPGVTVTKWTRLWVDRFPGTPLTVEVIEEPDQLTALREGRVDMCFVREPADRDGLHTVPLYAEVAVVVVPKDHPVAAYDAVTLADLDDESMQDRGDDVAVTLEMVAAGVGPVVLPHSLARLHARKDLVYRPVTDAPPTQVFLAWPVENGEDDTDPRQEFLGIVRGRSEHSSRAAAERRTGATPATRPTRRKTAAPARKTPPRPTSRRKRAR